MTEYIEQESAGALDVSPHDARFEFLEFRRAGIANPVQADLAGPTTGQLSAIQSHFNTPQLEPK
jgi:hypothetical protein